MRNHQVFDDSIDPVNEDNPADEQDEIAFCINKTSKEAKSVKSYWNEDHVVRIFYYKRTFQNKLFIKYVVCSQK